MIRPGAWARNLSWFAAAVALALLVVGTFVAGAGSMYRIGLPLDDAWIHQTYARNLALHGEWSFVPGQPSGGSTSPLWTVLLAVGFFLGAPSLAWAYGLGALALAGAALVLAGDRRTLTWTAGWAGWLVGLTILLDWHLVWSAASGMEVTLVVLLVAIVIRLSAAPRVRPVVAGAVVGLGIWIRPDAISLVLIPGLTILGSGDRLRTRLQGILVLLLAAGAVVGPYLLFNLATAGSIWPSTFFAKQAEYAVVRELPLAVRFSRVLAAPLIGAGILLMPGVVLSAREAVRRQAWGRLGPLLWAVGFLALFAVRLPVTYQHGRYQIPVIPVLILMGWDGIGLAARSWARSGRVLARAWAAAVVALAIGFLALGAQAYARDVALIESEMVETARWIADRTEPGALVAAHDIGALGFFADRPVIDLAGLADPEVIPILREEAALAAWLDQRGARYLMTFPSWYPRLTGCADLLYASPSPFAEAQGGEAMSVYRWPAADELRPQGCMLYSP